MNDRMEQEIRQTIRRLQASMPTAENRQAPILVLLQIAASEMDRLYLLALFAGTLAFGVLVSKVLSQPMLTAFCTAPTPMLLLFHRHILSCDDRMRELEATFQYSYTEMLTARASVISGYMLVALLSLSAVLHFSVGENFLRLALCGAVPSLYLSTLLLYLADKVRNQETLSLLSVVLWAALCFFSYQLFADRLLQICPTAVYAALTIAGLILYGACVHTMQARRRFCGIRVG